MYQKTIKKSVEIVGIGLHKGQPIKMKLEPLPKDSGIIFHRNDLGISIPLKPQYIVSTQLATTIGKDGATIHTIEHFLSALFAYGIDNLLVIVHGDEIPIMDGSSMPFCMLLEEAQVINQDGYKKVMVIKETIEVKDNKRFVRLEPYLGLEFDFTILFDHPLIREQRFKFDFSTINYKKEIAKARTFGFLHEVQYLRSKGLALGGSLQNAIVLDEKKVLNNEGLRFKDEFVRHKILDAIGDLSILGYPLLAKYSSFAGSHHLNYLLMLEVLKSKKNYEIIELKGDDKQEIMQNLNLFQDLFLDAEINSA